MTPRTVAASAKASIASATGTRWLVDHLPDAKGKKRPNPAFGPHVLRHVAASLWIEQGLPPKKVQELLGHSTLALTMDLYGHLWKDDAGDDALARASEELIPAART